MTNRLAATIALLSLTLSLTPGIARADERRPATAPPKAGGLALSIQGGFGGSFAGTANDGDQYVEGYEEMDAYHGFHAELSVFAGHNFVRGWLSVDLGYHAHVSASDVDVIQRHQLALVLARSDMFALFGVGGSVLHDVGFESIAPFLSCAVIAGYRLGPVSISFPFEVEFPIGGSLPIQSFSLLVGYASL